ncbi:MAG: tetratricopeptide repeat protein [Bacteroidota bacterium]
MSLYIKQHSVSALLFLSGLLVFAVFLSACSTSGTGNDLDKIRSQEALIDSLEKAWSKSGNPDRELTTNLREEKANLASMYESYAAAHSDENSPEFLFNAATLYQHGISDLNKALALCDQIIKDYPESERAADALFNKGFIYHNQIRDTHAAKMIYSEFLERYPTHNFADGAQFELNNLGVPADEVFKLIEKGQEANPDSFAN